MITKRGLPMRSFIIDDFTFFGDSTEIEVFGTDYKFEGDFHFTKVLLHDGNGYVDISWILKDPKKVDWICDQLNRIRKEDEESAAEADKFCSEVNQWTD